MFTFYAVDEGWGWEGGGTLKFRRFYFYAQLWYSWHNDLKIFWRSSSRIENR